MLTNKQLNKRRQNRYTVWKLIYLFAIALILSSTLYFAFFIYQNIFNTLSNSYAIGVLGGGASIDIIDNRSYDTAREAVNAKGETPPPPAKIRNIFINQQKNATSTSANAN